MKRNLKVFSLAVLSTGALMSGAVHASTPVETYVPIEHVYSPVGFDSNDRTEVVVEGVLPNLCHKSPVTTSKIVGNTIKITVKALKYDSSNPFCPEIALPFVSAVNVGLLDKGNYDIVVNGKTVFEKKSAIEVAEASSDAVDDFIYANVDHVEKHEGSRVVDLKGYNPSDCLQLDKVEYYDNAKDTYSVLPKMKQVSTFCPMKMVAFTFPTEVPTKLESEKVLLHVRVMEGKSVNAIFENE